MTEVTITTNKVQNLVGSNLHVWGWEVPLDLFLGGLTAGILVIVSWMILRNKGKGFALTTGRLAVFAPIALSIAMMALFLDLENKINVWRFYTTFRITSPMSWGSWVLLTVYPLSILLILGSFRESFPKAFARLESFVKSKKFMQKHMDKFHLLFDFPKKHIKLIAKLTIPVGVMLGIYTGILLSSLNARPFWNSGLMGPLFLVSGISTAAALVVLLSKEQDEKVFFTKVLLGLIVLILGIISLFIIGMLSSSLQHQEAIKLILGGPLTAFFWVLVVGLGLMLPAFLLTMELRGREIPAAFAALLVLVGGVLLRFVIVEAGQISTWGCGAPTL